MNVKRTFVIALLVAGAFLAGNRVQLRHSGIITYRIGNDTIAFHHDNPLSGLQPLHFAFMLDSLRRGDTNQAISRIEGILNSSIDSARQRRPLLNGKGLQSLDKLLGKVADYRARFPSDSAETLTNAAGASIWYHRVAESNSVRKREIDAFLKQFESANRAKERGSTVPTIDNQ